MKPPFILFLALFLGGCAIADFTPYEGAQQNWPTANGAFVSHQYVVPAYYGFPARPYTVLGYLDATTAPVADGEWSRLLLAARRKWW
jgi:hypothetical protein